MGLNVQTFASGVNFGSLASAPTNPSNGDVYYDTSLNAFRGYQNGAWQNLISGGGSSDPITLAQIPTPGAPASGSDSLYFKSDDNLYKLDSDGQEVAITGAGIGGTFSAFASSQVTTRDTGISATSFTTFSNSPAFTFTPSISGAYKVYCAIPLLQGVPDQVGMARVFNTSGGASLLQESQISSFSNTGDSLSSGLAQSTYTLMAGTTYIFDIQGSTTSGGQVFATGDESPFYMFAEGISLGSTVSNASNFYASSQVTTRSSVITSSTFVTADNSPAFTFTPSISGVYKVYANAGIDSPTTLGSYGLARVFNTSGGATLLQESQGITGDYTNDINTVPIQSTYSLVAGTEYVFDIQILQYLGTGGGYQLDGLIAPFYMFAEIISLVLGSGSGTLSNPIELPQISTPVPPISGSDSLYFKSDHNLYKQNSAGQEYAITGDGIGGSFVSYASSQVTTQSSGITSGTFTTFNNSPALTFTPTISGTYKVYCAPSLEIDSSTEAVGVCRVYNTSGGATLLQESQGWVEAPGATNLGGGSPFCQSTFTLTAGVTYVFDLQGYVGGSGTLYNYGNDSAFYMFAEGISLANSAASNFYTSSQVTTLGTAITATSFTTFSNSPAFTFTPTVGGTYKVYCPLPLYVTAASVANSQIINTSGGATLLSSSEGVVYVGVSGGVIDTAFTQATYNLVAGTAYVFDIQGKTAATGNVYADGEDCPFYMFAELVSVIVGNTNAPVTSNYASANFDSTNEWYTTSGSMTDLTFIPGNGTLNVMPGSTIALTAAASNIFGVTWTPQTNASVYQVICTWAPANTGSGSTADWTLTDGTTIIDANGFKSAVGDQYVPSTLYGIYAPGTTSPVTVKIQGSTNGELYTNGSSGVAAYFRVIQIA